MRLDPIERGRWRIDEIAPDFRLEDVWALPAEGGAEEFPALLEVMGSITLSDGGARAAGLLVAARERLGAWFGWDEPDGELPVPGAGETTLAARLPPDLRGSAQGAGREMRGFRPLYRTDRESAAEISNKTVHALSLIHI